MGELRRVRGGLQLPERGVWRVGEQRQQAAGRHPAGQRPAHDPNPQDERPDLQDALGRSSPPRRGTRREPRQAGGGGGAVHLGAPVTKV